MALISSLIAVAALMAGGVFYIKRQMEPEVWYDACVEISLHRESNHLVACFRTTDEEQGPMKSLHRLEEYGDRVNTGLRLMQRGIKDYCPGMFSCNSVQEMKVALAGLGFFESLHKLVILLSTPNMKLTSLAAKFEGFLDSGLSFMVRYEEGIGTRMGVGFTSGFLIYNYNINLIAEFYTNGRFSVRGDTSHSLSLSVFDVKFGVSLGFTNDGVTLGLEAGIRPLIGGRVEVGLGRKMSAKIEYMFFSDHYRTLVKYSVTPAIEHKRD